MNKKDVNKIQRGDWFDKIIKLSVLVDIIFKIIIIIFMLIMSYYLFFNTISIKTNISNIIEGINDEVKFIHKLIEQHNLTISLIETKINSNMDSVSLILTKINDLFDNNTLLKKIVSKFI